MDSYSFRFRCSRFLKKITFYVRSFFYSSPVGIDNIYLCTIQKSGSQWLRKILSDGSFAKKTNLCLFPAHRYEYSEYISNFPRGVVVQGLYLNYEQYLEIKKPRQYKTIYLMRDPRDIVVSWYYSMRDSHGLIGHVRRHRDVLLALNQEDGIDYCIEALAVKFSYMRSWFSAAEKSNILFLRLEDVEDNPHESLNILLKFLNVSFSDLEIATLAEKYSKKNMRENDIRKRGGGDVSHYRAVKSDYRQVFSDRNMSKFNEINGNLLKLVGYE